MTAVVKPTRQRILPLRSDEHPQEDGARFRCGGCGTTIPTENVTSTPHIDGGAIWFWHCDDCGLSFEWERTR